MRRGIRWMPFCIALLWLPAFARSPAASAQPTITEWFDVLQMADAASVLKLRKLGLSAEDESEVLNQIFAGVFDRAFGERFDPVSLSGLFEIAESIRRGEFKVPPGQVSKPLHGNLLSQSGRLRRSPSDGPQRLPADPGTLGPEALFRSRVQGPEVARRKEDQPGNQSVRTQRRNPNLRFVAQG